jgi:hypothetical protein
MLDKLDGDKYLANMLSIYVPEQKSPGHALSVRKKERYAQVVSTPRNGPACALEPVDTVSIA